MHLSMITPSLDPGSPILETVASLDAAIRMARARNPALEVEQIVIDDGSTDPATFAAYERLRQQYPFCRIECDTGSRRGPADARNRGIARARGDWIGFIDADDLIDGDGFAALIDVAMSNVEAGWVLGDTEAFYPDGRTEAKVSYFRRLLSGEPPLRVPSEQLTPILAGPPNVFLGSMIVRRELLEQVGGFDPSLICGEDWYLTLKLSLIASVWYVPHRVERLRRGHPSLTQSPRTMGPMAFKATVRALRDRSFVSVRKVLRWTLLSQIAHVRDRHRDAGNRIQSFKYGLLCWIVAPEQLGLLKLAFVSLGRLPERH